MEIAVSSSIKKVQNYLSVSSGSDEQVCTGQKRCRRDYVLARKYEKRYKKKAIMLLRIISSSISFFKGMGVPRRRIHRGSLWTGVVLLTLTCGVKGLEQEQLPSFTYPEQQDAALLKLFRELYQQQLIRQMMVSQQLQQLPEPGMDQLKRASYEQLPLPYALHLGDSSEETKRGSSYMALCHFKICSVGKKRSSRLYG